MDTEEKEDSVFDIVLREVEADNDDMEADDDVHRLDDYLTIAELREAFSLEELLRMVKDGTLQSWLWERLLDVEAQELSEEKTAELSDDELRVMLCRLFEVDVTRLPACEAASVEQSLAKCRLRDMRRASCGKDGAIVTDQRSLVEAMQDASVRKFYLFDGAYTIPLQREGTTYDGRGNALIEIKARGDEPLDLDAREIYFYNLTLVFHYLVPSQVKLEASRQNGNTLIFLQADKVALAPFVTQQDVLQMLAGRTPFELPEQFEKRLHVLDGTVLGTVLLEAENYDIKQKTFFVRPVWKVDFAEMIRRYVDGDSLYFYSEPTEAESMYQGARRQLVYAEFCADGDCAAIVRIFLLDANGKRIYIVRAGKGTSWHFQSGSCGMGYGLDLIAPLS